VHHVRKSIGREEIGSAFRGSSPGNDPSISKLLDLQMLLIGGKERSEEEFRALYREAGFEMTRIVPTRSSATILEGIRT
jgi:hypothetical protein